MLHQYTTKNLFFYKEREEAAFRRRKLEAIGGGGSQFAMPVRDWRGISYVKKRLVIFVCLEYIVLSTFF